jgi:endonuclease YncB( thermonuclease family)
MMRNGFWGLGLLVAWGLAGTVFGSTNIVGRVVGAHDGDTVTVLDAGNQQIKIRLNQIDAPELSQDFGRSSKQSLSDLVFGKQVRIEVADTDRYGRTVGTIWIGGTDVNLEQVKRGQAWAYRKYLKDPAYLDAEEAAKRARLGLWSLPNPIPPWEYRHPERRGGGEAMGRLSPALPSAAAPRSGSSAGCGTKRLCKDMTSCEEARFFLETCGVTALDRDGDGVACESLCR